MNSRNLLASTTPKLGLQVCAVIPDFYMGSSNQNSDFHAWIASTLQVEPSLHFAGWAISPSPNLKPFEYQNDVTSEKFHTWVYIVGEQACQKHYTELPLGYVHKIHVRYKWILCLDLVPSPKISHYEYVDIPKSDKILSISGLKHGRWRILNLSMLSQRDLHFNGVRMKTASRCILSPGISVTKGGNTARLAGVGAWIDPG